MIKIIFIVLSALLVLLTGCAPSLFTQGRGMIERGEYRQAADL